MTLHSACRRDRKSHPRDILRVHYGRSKPARCRSHRPHIRRKAVVGFPALGRRLRRTALHRTDVAGIRGGRSRRGVVLVPSPRAPVRRPAIHRAAGCPEPVRGKGHPRRLPIEPLCPTRPARRAARWRCETASDVQESSDGLAAESEALSNEVGRFLARIKAA